MVTKKDWVDGLARYKRGQGVFRSLTDEYCPLGVLAELLIKEGTVPGLAWEKGEESYLLVCDGEKKAYEWPTSLRLLTGVTIEAFHLVRFNDSADRTNPDSSINSKTPWKDIQEWMQKTASGKDKTPAIHDFDTKKGAPGKA